MKKIITLLVLLIITSYAYTTTINIPTDYSTIQAGIDAASDYDTVLVDSGTYVENINFNGKNITVASLFLTTQDTSYISQSVIDGDSSGSVVTFDSGEDSTSVLIGFTITNGNASWGGGIYCNNNSNPSLVNVTITNNTAGSGGGGIYCDNNSNPSLVNVTISNNTTADSGGGIICSNSSPSLENVTITNNSASDGGGICCRGNSSPSLVNVTISNNSADYSGGGIYCMFSSPSLVDVEITGNSATGDNGRGGGIYCCSSSPSLENVTITNNSAATCGGGIYCSNSSPSLVNVTISNNSADYSGGGIYCTNNSSPSLVNCILWNDSPQEVYFFSYGDPNSITISYSDIEGGEAGIITNDNGTVYWEECNIDLNPLFVDPTIGDYHLTENSPCIDAGDPDSPLDPDGTISDMGSYYYNYCIIARFTADQTSGYAPLNVNFTDLSLHLNSIASWQWDFQNDGTIDSYEQNPTHTYQNARSYSVSLTVTDENDSTDTIIIEDYIYVEEGNTIDGYAYLENQTQHDSIEVYFEMQAPDDSTYTVYTDNGGYYNLQVTGGFYDITYSKDGYYSENLYGKNLFSNTTLNDITLIEHTTTINVPAQFDSIQTAIDNAWEGDTVLVDTGTYVENINFNGKNITVASMFLTTQDTSYISQTVIDGNQDGSVVTFESGEDSTSILTGFTLENGNADYGGGISCDDSSSPSLQSVTITNNSSGDDGGGISCRTNSSPSLVDVEITGNSASDYGGGIYCYDNSSPSLENVIITDNTANYDDGGGISCSSSDPSLQNVTITNNSAYYGGGIYCYDNSSPNLENVTISNNTADYGGGIYCYDSPSLENVTITNNTSTYLGGGIYCRYSDTSLNNVTISNNSADDGCGGIYCYESSPSLINTIVSNNTGNYGIYVESGDPSIEYCDFYNNENGNFYGCDQYIGQIVTTNANGDICDAYYNIQMDPCFVDSANGNYHLTENSPCIDAGDPSSPLDPDGTIADIGAYYYNQGQQSVDDETEYIARKSFISYPNPITNLTNEINISFAQKKPSKVNLKLYNIKGQVVTQILDDNKPSGTHTISSNIRNLASGIYFIKMSVDGKNRAVKKMVKIE